MDITKETKDFGSWIKSYKAIAVILALACVVCSVLAVTTISGFDYDWWEFRKNYLEEEYDEVSSKAVYAYVYESDELMEEIHREQNRIVKQQGEHEDVKEEMYETFTLWLVFACVCGGASVAVFVWGKKRNA